MPKTISNTLTRWHKVADRIKQAANALKQSNLQAAHAGQGLDCDTFSIRQTTMRAAAAKAVGEQTVLYFALQDALFAIRRALAHANVAHGVSDLLCRMEQEKQNGDYFEAMAEIPEGVLSQDEYAQLCVKRAANRDSSSREMDGVQVTFLSEDEIAALGHKREAARKSGTSLADQLADANATKLSLTLEDSVIEAVGL